MSQPRYVTAIVATLALGAAAPRAEAQDSDPYRVQWSSPSIIDSQGPGRGAFASINEYYSSLNGRTMWLQEFMAGFGFTDSLSIWVGRQNYVLHGHSSVDRFNLQDDEFGGKWVIKKPSLGSDASLAAEFTIFAPGTATAETPNSFESFRATKDYSGALDFGPGHGWETQVAYTSVKGAVNAYANIYSLGVGKDLKFGRLQARLQGQLVCENSTDPDGLHSGNAFKPILYASAGYDVVKWFRVEAEGTLFTSGMPLGGSQFTGLSSFLIYNPGGAAADLPTDVVGIVDIRLVFHGKF